MMRLVKLGAACLLMFSASGCAIHGCSGGGKFVCDPDGSNCRWQIGFDCDFGPPYPRPSPTPPFPMSSDVPAGSLAEAAASFGESDTNGDGILSCNGVYYIGSGSWVGSCN